MIDQKELHSHSMTTHCLIEGLTHRIWALLYITFQFLDLQSTLRDEVQPEQTS